MTDIKEPTGIEGFRAWYRNHTGKMITRANAEKAVRSFASPAPSASMGRVTDAMVEDAFEGYLSVMGIPYEPGNPHPKVALRAALVAAIAALDPPPDHGGKEGWVLVPREPTEAMLVDVDFVPLLRSEHRGRCDPSQLLQPDELQRHAAQRERTRLNPLHQQEREI